MEKKDDFRHKRNRTSVDPKQITKTNQYPESKGETTMKLDDKNYKYVVFHADEDGKPFSFLTEFDLMGVLNEGDFGEINILKKEDLKKLGLNPSNTWSYHNPKLDVLIYELGEPLEVEPVTTHWRIKK